MMIYFLIGLIVILTITIVVLVSRGRRSQAIEPAKKTVPLEPWHNHHRAKDCLLLPVPALWWLAGDATLEQLAQQAADRIRLIGEDIAANGLKQPLNIQIDGESNVAVSDGHHRIWLSMQAGRETLPVHFEAVPRLINQNRQPVSQFLTRIAHYS